ncbi:MurR/RpiR family transcriptional regulator [Mycoplasma tauri]|uniref:MurR/RpiR family transcriptional regulator n=1 Tax=Mycoplasma tauri TaxID=547987 RepID=A0A953ND66_9MOLU|nr:MurR/RpiR family transcriptional regulator [Mycoplasma tauri]MBZ4195425.1 MurR/RpiR family transcriptional regulator [Mycoplasma tauri]MBZ4203575.1 MurR/RpiR family transcriptional regulator [Mycoplasma tauri]MBZ4204404.1 MurR/RpiR family transcriptional regulator [Mycoplasma tauri]MBZ4212676.1 MurR/RpiR family transcriptional regulator [Mycoplasma tauri]MBZ4218056.1 MurR/RpiR family transcriptional regulator [Mycoplasma tauri]
MTYSNKTNVKRPILSENTYLTKSEKNILKFINSFEKNEFDLSIVELAKISKTSESSVSRFVKKYGYKDYRSFIAAINIKLSNFTKMYPIEYDENNNLNPFTVIHSSYKFAIDNISTENVIYKCKKASKLINNSNKIFIYGSGSSQRISADLAANLIKLGMSVVSNPDFHIFFPCLANGNHNDLLIVFSNNLKSNESHFVIKNANKNNIKVIAITSAQENENKNNNLNVNLMINYEKIHNDSLLVPVSSKVSQMLIGNMLFEALIYNNPENYNKLQKTSELIDEWAQIDKNHS